MSLTETFLAQLADPFRIGLIVALLATTLRTEAATGRVLPLATGVVFVAALIPLTIGHGEGPGLAEAIGVGLAANAVILAAVMAAWAAVKRLRG